MNLILLLTIIYTTPISDATVCYQCNGPSTISNQYAKEKIDNLLKQSVGEYGLDSHNIFCHNLDDLGVEKTCDQGSICFFAEVDIDIAPKEKAAVRSCVKQNPENPHTLLCTNVDSKDQKFKMCWCNTNKCNKESTVQRSDGNLGSTIQGSNSNFITNLCYR